MAALALDRRGVLAAAAALLLAACAPATTRPAAGRRPQSPTTDPRWDRAAGRVRFDGFAGGPGFGLPDDLAGRPLVVNFWASWCAPCRKEMPVFQAVAQQLRGRVDFLGVDYLDQAGAARRLAAETGVTYRLAADPRGRAGTKLGITGLPTTLFIDAGGVLAVAGSVSWTPPVSARRSAGTSRWNRDQQPRLRLHASPAAGRHDAAG